MAETQNQAAAEALFRVAAGAVREAIGELARDPAISMDEFNEFCRRYQCVGKLNDAADGFMLNNWRKS